MRIHYDNIPGMNLSPHRYTKKWSVPTSGAVRLPRMLKASSSSFLRPRKLTGTQRDFPLLRGEVEQGIINVFSW